MTRHGTFQVTPLASSKRSWNIVTLLLDRLRPDSPREEMGFHGKKRVIGKTPHRKEGELEMAKPALIQRLTRRMIGDLSSPTALTKQLDMVVRLLNTTLNAMDVSMAHAHVRLAFHTSVSSELNQPYVRTVN
jgi:hypothetical protein